MTSVGVLDSVWPVLSVVRRCVVVLPVLVGLLAGLAAVVNGHRPHHARRASSAAGDQRGIHDSRVVQDAEYV